jgi:RNA polymerase sigma-70 factor (ECF subfamily)
MVFGLLDRALGSRSESEDLTQEVFWRVFAAAPKIREPSALRSFIYSSAVRMLRWHLRTRRVRQLFFSSRFADEVDAACPPADSEGREILTRFYHLLDTLGTEERTAFVLRHIESLSLDEIVTATGASLATVKRRIRRASDKVTALAKADPDLVQYLVQGRDSDESIPG